jgi:putative component of toxin-antitoxin plasmid stabilization module
MSELRTYQRKVTEAQAIQFTGNPEDLRAVGVFIDDHNRDGGPDWRIFVAKHDEYAQIVTGDWVIRELDGSGFYPCRADVFAATYEVG